MHSVTHVSYVPRSGWHVMFAAQYAWHPITQSLSQPAGSPVVIVVPTVVSALVPTVVGAVVAVPAVVPAEVIVAVASPELSCAPLSSSVATAGPQPTQSTPTTIEVRPSLMPSSMTP